MIRYEHLEQYELKLITKTPVFVGSGREYNKRDYYFDAKNKKVHFINIPGMMSMLYSKNLINEYEEFILNRPYENLNHFFRDYNISTSEINLITDYTANAADAIVEGKSFAGVMQFVRDPQHRPYIPGSSVKGCLRTVLLWKLIQQSNQNELVNDYKKARKVEANYLNTVILRKDEPHDEINSIMRGISISDSLPIDNDRMILTRKIDVSTSGKSKTVNVVREAIAPETTVKFVLTLDKSVDKNLDDKLIMEAVKNFASYYKETYLSSFHIPEDAVNVSGNFIVFGGGSGYFGKNIAYPIYGKALAVKKVSEIMKDKFEKHYHEKDVVLGISPHMLKYTKYHSRLYQYGVCEVVIN